MTGIPTLGSLATTAIGIENAKTSGGGFFWGGRGGISSDSVGMPYVLFMTGEGLVDCES